jgi:hypothetical protein
MMVKFIGDDKRLINLDHVRKLEISSRSEGKRLDVTWADGRREKFKRLSEELVESIERLLHEPVAQRMDTMHQGGNEAHHHSEKNEASVAETIASEDTATDEVSSQGGNEARHHSEKTEAPVAETIASEDTATDEVSSQGGNEAHHHSEKTEAPVTEATASEGTERTDTDLSVEGTAVHSTAQPRWKRASAHKS